MLRMTDRSAAGPTLAEQVTRLYDLIAGYHVTNLIEIARQLGVWEAIATAPGMTSATLAERLGTDAYYTDGLCRTAFAFELLDRAGGGWRMAPHMDAILAHPDSPSYLATAPRVHMMLGAEDYPTQADRIRTGSVTTFQEHSVELIAEVGDGLRALPRLFVDLVVPRLPKVAAALEAGGRVLDIGCGAGWAIVELAERFPRCRVDGVDIEPRSIELAQARIDERGLGDRCSARLIGETGVFADAPYEVVTMFLVVHEIRDDLKDTVLASAARALLPGGSLVIFDEAYPETDAAMRTMPSRFTTVAQWFELTWGNRIDTAAVLRARCARAGLPVRDETTFSRFTILVAPKPG
jgi:SAM-dependent methyltransferase